MIITSHTLELVYWWSATLFTNYLHIHATDNMKIPIY